MLDSRGDNDAGSRHTSAASPKQQTQQQSRPAPNVQHDAHPAPDYDSFDDDIPF